MGRGLRHFGLLVWKNYKLQIRRPVSAATAIKYTSASFVALDETRRDVHRTIQMILNCSLLQIATAFEIGLPTFVIVILVIIRHVINTNDELQCPAPLAPNSSCYFPDFDPLQMAPSYSQGRGGSVSCSNFSLAYAPS